MSLGPSTLRTSIPAEPARTRGRANIRTTHAITMPTRAIPT
ncbi:Uncharacterised protein [Mycobacteroides abscessus subsp. abscessus]|nr:Uncharacterised protein [Mycobacteroides abscessus subsp. abscessus]